jgi:glycosyltransferase-like protein
MSALLRIAILVHSTNPRGGVVHALALADALVRLGHEPVVHAPGQPGQRFPRGSAAETLVVPASPTEGGPTAMVRARIADYVRHFGEPRRRRFDVYHAQCGIGANALATLKEAGRIEGFTRTVHHLDRFADTALQALQERGVAAADRLFVVSRLWREALQRDFGRECVLVGNGVDLRRFSPRTGPADAELGARLGLGVGPVFLAVGGIEERKNSLRILEAFAALRELHPSAQLVVAGGASVLDHGRYRAAFGARLGAAGLPPEAVIVTGPLADEDLPPLYRLADTLVFPSLVEGFGLVVLEAMASGVPVVTSRISPFTEYLAEDDVLWCDPADPASIATALAASLDPASRAHLRARGLARVKAHRWEDVARAHLPAYRDLAEPVHA